MSAIKDLVSNYNERQRNGLTGTLSVGRHEVMYAIEEWEKL